MMPAARDLAEIAVAHEHALRGLRSIHPVDLDQRIVEQAGDQVRLVQPVGLERPLRRRGEAGRGFEVRAVEGNIAVVVGEAEHHAVIAHDPPAPAQRGGAGVEMVLESR